MKYRIITILAVVLTWAPLCPAVEYQVVDLGELSTYFGELWRPLSINDAGQVAGATGDVMSGSVRGYLWENGFTYLSTQDADWANDVNAGKMVVGAEAFLMFSTPFYWQNGSKTPLPTLGLDIYGEALAVNDNGKIAGIVHGSNPSFTKAAFWKDDGTVKELVIIDRLSTSDDFNYATDINNNDKVVGYSGDISRHRAFVWEEGLPPSELAMLQSDDLRARANAINNLDQAAGYIAGLDGEDHAVLWQNDEVVPLGPLNSESWALNINDNEQVVGIYSTADDISAFLWENGNFIDLNDQLADGSGWVLYEAHDINNDGWIVGVGSFNGGSEMRGFLLMPLPDEAITAEVAISPGTLNLKGKAKWIICNLQLPAGYDVFNIDPSSIRLWDEFAPDPDKVHIDPDAQILTARFSRAAIEHLLAPGMAKFVISGELWDGTKFEGADEIRVKGR
ncbi:hypothetical protein ACFL02_03715 [Planctomycetota bacterium]